MKKMLKKIGNYLHNEHGFGLYEVIGIAAVLLVAAFVVIPGFRAFSQGIMLNMQTWFDTSIVASIFPTG